MAIPKWVEIYKDKSLSGDSGTETFPLKRNDQVLEYMLKVRAKNTATGNSPDNVAMNTIESCISKIEVRSGSAIFKSYNGELCRKLATYRNGRLPQTLHSQANGGTWAGNEDPALGWSEYSFPINFNIPSDPYANKTGIIMPAPLYDSLDLVLEYNFPTTAGAGFITGGSNKLFSLYALVKPKVSTEEMMQRRILVEEKKHDYTSLSSGDKDFGLTLDKDRFLRELLVFCYENEIGEGVDINYLKLKVDGDTYIESKWGDLQAKNAVDCSLVYNLPMHLTAISAHDELFTRVPAPNLTGLGNQATAAMIVSNTADSVTVTVNAADDVSFLNVASDVIPATAIINFDEDGMLMNMQHQGVKDLELIITNGGAGGTVKILEQSVCKVWGHSV